MTSPVKRKRRWNAPICHRKAHSNTGLVGITDTVHRRRGIEFPRFVVSYRKARGVHATKTFYYGTNGLTRAEALALAQAFRALQVARRTLEEGPLC